MRKLRPFHKRALIRSGLIQGSWNYRTMIGGGFCYAMLPLLRHIYRDEPDLLEEAVSRHAEHFNAHPYLATIALGAVARMEADGEPPAEIRRFKTAVRGPLGSLGDTLIWGAWLPVSVLLGLVFAFAGARPAIVVATFLLLYNAGHLLVRVWGLRIGIRMGRQVGEGIRSANAARQLDWLAGAGALLAGALISILAMEGFGIGRVPWPWLLASALTLGLGYAFGQRVQRGETYAFMLLISAIFLIGML
jgi:mannose PTS system EIID component